MSLDGICDPKFTSSHLNDKTHHRQRKRLSYSLGGPQVGLGGSGNAVGLGAPATKSKIILPG